MKSVLLTVVVAFALGANQVRSAPQRGQLLWEDRLDLSPFEQAYAVASLNHAVFVSGFVGVPGDRDFLVRAYDDRSGALLWQDRVVIPPLDEFASGVATDNARVFASGSVGVPGRGYDWIVRAYAADSGVRLWERVFDLARGRDFSRGPAIATGNGLVFVGGYGTNAQGRRVWIVRAYEAGSGTIAWEDRVDGGVDSGVQTLAFKAGMVFVGGWDETATTGDVLVRAYDARSGLLRWEHRTTSQPGVPQLVETFAQKVVSDGERVFVGASLVRAEGSQRYLVQALDALSGALLWQDALNTGSHANFVADLDVHDGRVVAVGHGGAQCFDPSPGNCNSLVRAYDATTGVLAWGLELDASGTGQDDLARNVTASNGMVFVFSSQPPLVGVPGCCTVGTWLVQAFEGTSGRLLWESHGAPLESALNNMIVHRGRLVIPGRAIDPATGDWDFIVRTYDTRGAEADEREH